jgi:hypothetical protein
MIATNPAGPIDAGHEQQKQGKWCEQWTLLQDDERFLFAECTASRTFQDLRGKTVLECGCGGQHTAFVAPVAAQVTTVDLNAVDVVRERNRRFDNITSLEADIAYHHRADSIRPSGPSTPSGGRRSCFHYDCFSNFRRPVVASKRLDVFDKRNALQTKFTKPSQGEPWCNARRVEIRSTSIHHYAGVSRRLGGVRRASAEEQI